VTATNDAQAICGLEKTGLNNYAPADVDSDFNNNTPSIMQRLSKILQHGALSPLTGAA
jgi:hypothetical protein